MVVVVVFWGGGRAWDFPHSACVLAPAGVHVNEHTSNRF